MTVEETHGDRKALAAIGDQPLLYFEQRNVRRAPDQAQQIVAMRLDPAGAPIAPGRRRRNLARVIRTGGPAVTDDVLGELVVSTRVLGSKEIMLLNHTGRGFTTFTDKELNERLARETGNATPAPMRFFSYKDPEENTRVQIDKVRAHPWIANDVPVRGFNVDVDTGRLREVIAE